MTVARSSSAAAIAILVAACVITQLIAAPAKASPEPPYIQAPPWESLADKGTLSDPIRIGCIFVRFPNTNPAYWVYPDNAEQVLSDIEQSLQYQSIGRYCVDYSILRNPVSPDSLWAADHNSGLYQPANPLAPPTDFADCDTICGLISNELPLEILSAIQIAYPNQQPLANYDAIAFVYRVSGDDVSDNPLAPGYGGASAILVSDSCAVLSDVLEGAPISPTDNFLFGYTSVWWTIDGPNYPRFNMAHEWGHKMGQLLHSPSSAWVDSATNYPETICNFGAYSIMRSSHAGTIPYGMYDHYSRSRFGWSVIDTVTSNQRGRTVLDYGSNGDALIVPVRTEQGPLMELWPGHPEANVIIYEYEYFLVAYEGSRDWYYDPLDTGLYIWHILETRGYFPDATPPHWGEYVGQYLDLEVASGLDAMPSLIAVPWSHPDPVSGRDMIDCWRDSVTGEVRPGYNWYNGSLNDLFNLGAGEHGEFSFRGSSNPNTNGLDWSIPIPWAVLPRSAPQNRQNSIMIRILEQTADAVVLDVLLAPYEDVSSPNGGELLTVGEPAAISWNVDASLEITSVDIAYSANGGADYDTIAEGEPNDGEYVWTPTGEQVASAGRIKVVFHNTRSDKVGVDESDGTFAIMGPVTYDNMSGETGLNYTGVPYSSVVLDYDSDGKKDMFISMRDYPGSMQRQKWLSGYDIPQFEDKSDVAFAPGSEPQYGLRGVAVADYDNDSVIDFFAAAESGARLYHNDGGVFTDVATSAGLGAYATYSWAGAWGDYDRDGQLDLFISRGEGASQDPTPATVTPVNSYILRNNTRQSGTFIGGEIGSGITNASISASWADVDGDSDLDLFVGDLRSYGATPICRLYINEGEGIFTEDFSSRFSVTDLSGITSVAWVDMDNNGSLDLAVGGQLQPPMVLFNDGTGNFDGSVPLAADLSAAVNGVRPLDHDLDGRTDLVALPRESSDHPWLLANRMPSSIIELVDESAQVGLDASVGRVDGMVAADFNGDGDEDLYLGRLKDSGKYFYRATTSSGDAPAANWVGVRLVPNSGANNNDGIGATVTVTVGDPLAPIFKQAQVVDGGSGRGGQADATLIFGLGELEGTVQAKIRWPGGYVQTQQLVVGTVNVVNDLTAPTMVILKSQSPVFTYEVIPGTALVDWIFTWQTEFSCDPTLDQVRVSCRPNQPSNCLCDAFTLHAGDPSVQASVYAKANGRYQHSLRWRGAPCAASCSYNFTMGSATQRAGSLNETSMVGTISFCSTEIDPEQQ